MFLALFLLAASQAGPCTGPDTRTLKGQVWLSGAFNALPVVAAHQRKMMNRLRHGSFAPISASVAAAVIGDALLPRAAHYYLARVGYLGAFTSDFKGRDPSGISLEIKVAPGGIAYVTSSLLSRDDGVGEFAVVLASPTRITSVVSTCYAAA
jgi:hypothetical protein